MTNLIALLVSLATVPVQTYDFADRPLRDAAQRSTAKNSPKAVIRNMVADVQPRLVACADARPHAAGTIALRFTIEDTTLTTLDVDAVGDAKLSACMRDALWAMRVPGLLASANWVVYMPLTIDAR